MNSAAINSKEIYTDEIDVETIDDDVKKLLNSYDLQGYLPVEPIELANVFKIKVYKVDFESYEQDTVSGAIQVRNGETKIFVNKNDSILRQRFTIAHELGHYFMHICSMESNEFVDMHRKTGYYSTITTEVEANKFAAALLMPKDILIERFDKASNIGLGKEFILDWLCDQFKVSKQAMMYRLKNLKLEL